MFSEIWKWKRKIVKYYTQSKCKSWGCYMWNEIENEIAICEKHWPKCFEKIKVFEKHRQKNTPAVWDGIPEARFPTNQSWWEQPREHTVVLGTDKKINLFCWKRQGTHDKLLNEIVQPIYSHSNSFMVHQCY